MEESFVWWKCGGGDQGQRPDAPERLSRLSEASCDSLQCIVRRHFSGAFAALNAPYSGTKFSLLRD